MATELENRCPICLDSWEEASYMTPCLHQFCYECILRWAQCKPECPLYKREVTSILHSVRGDDDFKEHVIPPPAASPVGTHLAGRAPGHPATHNLRRPAASQPSGAGLVPRAAVGGLHPHIWAFILHQRPALLGPLLTWLRQELWLNFEGDHWEAAAAAQRLVLTCLPFFDLDEETLFRLLHSALGRHARGFVRWLIEAVVDRCSREARRQKGLEDARAAEEQEGSPAAAPGPAASRRGSPAPSPAPSSSLDRLEVGELPSTSLAALRGGAGSPRSAPIPTHGQQEELREGPEEAVPGPSARSWGSERSPGSEARMTVLEFLTSCSCKMEGNVCLSPGFGASPKLHNLSKMTESGLTVTSASALNTRRQIPSGSMDLYGDKIS